jgi:glycerophosphoryl diester phosphodiesterase
MLVIAHRGASRDAPENTIEAFELAVRQGADMIETDLQLTGDRHVVLRHDSVIDGDEIGDMTLSALRERDPAVPLLSEALDAVGADIPFNLELKRREDGELHAGMIELALDEVVRRGWLERTLFSSFYDPALARLRELEPRSRLALLISPRSALKILERAERLGAEAVNPERRLATAELVEQVHASGRCVYVYTVDEPAEQQTLRERGVDGIFTNVPAALRRLLAQ